ITGYGVVEVGERGLALCEAGVIRGGDRGPLAERVREISQELAAVIENFRPIVLALEQLYSHYERPRTAILMGHARGVICLAAAQAGIPVRSSSLPQVKTPL